MPLTIERREYVPVKEILLEAEQALKSHGNGGFDWVTFVGSGEPTLYSCLGELICSIKNMTALPVAVITNGSLLYRPKVREELSAADAILPTLDAGTAELHRRINRPHPQVTFEQLVDGLIALRKEYYGKLWVETMLVQNLNDSLEAIEDIAKTLRQIKPDAVHINLPTRPPAETWVQPPDEESLLRAISILGNIAKVVHPAEGNFDLSGYENVMDAIISIITRHPMRQDELERALARWSTGQVGEALAGLESSDRAQVVERYGVRFWSAAPSQYSKKHNVSTGSKT